MTTQRFRAEQPAELPSAKSTLLALAASALLLAPASALAQEGTQPYDAVDVPPADVVEEPPADVVEEPPADVGEAPPTQGAAPAESAPAEPIAEPVEPVGDEVDAYAEMSLEELLSLQVVTSASRRAQSMHEAPSSVSLLDFDDIERMRGMNVAQPFRRLLGVYVFQQTSSVFQVIVRNSFSVANNNEVLVLMDGRNTVEAIRGFSPWTYMPLTPEELESAEVIRGAGGVLYGANATGGVISLRTRRPIDHPGLEGRVRAGLSFTADDDEVAEDANAAGTLGLGHVAYNYANDARTFGMRFSLGARSLPDYVPPIAAPPTHGMYGYHALVGVEARPSEDVSFYGTVSHTQTEFYEPLVAVILQGTMLMSEQAVNLNYEHGGLLDDHLTIHSNVDYTRAEGSGNDIHQTSHIGHGRVQADLSLWGGRSITTLAGDFTYLDAKAADSRPNATTVGASLQEELRLLKDEQLILSAAARFDSVAYSDVGVPDLHYRNPTVRGSVIYRFTPEQDVRVTVANAYRTPLPYESSVATYLGSGPGAFPVAIPNPNLDSTVNQMVELGYRGDLFDHLRAEAVFSMTRIKDPVFPEPNVLTPPIGIVQGDDQHFVQGEIGLTGIIRHGAEVYANYVTIHRTRENSADTMQLRIPNRLSLGGSVRFDNGFFLQGDVEMYWNLTHIRALPEEPDTIPDLYDVNVRLGRRILDDRVEVFGEVWNAAGFFRDRSDLVRTYPSITPSVPIPGTALIGVALRTE